MSAFAQSKTRIEERLARESGELKELLTEIGKHLVDAQRLPDDEPFADLLSQQGSAQATISELEATRDRIVSITQRTDEIQRTLADIGQRRKAIDSDLEPQYREIGAQAFRVFRDNPLIDQEYADIFTPLLESHEEARRLERELEAAQAELADKNFLEKMVTRGRVVVLRNRIAIKEGQQRRMHTDAGRQIAGTDFVRTIGDPSLDEAAAPFLELMEESKRLAADARVLEDERAALAAELETLGVDRRADSRLADLRKAISDGERTRNEVLVQIAEEARRSELDAKELAASGEALSALDQAITADADLVRRLEKAIEAERVRGDIDQLDTQIERKKQQIATLEADIGQLDERRADLASKETKLKKQRGPVKDLTNLEL